MSFEGHVDIALPVRGGGKVEVHYKRPVDVSPLLTGKRPEEVMPVVAAIYGICANAQAHASVLALEGALGKTADPGIGAARALVTAMETLRENLLRIALDWPRLIGDAPDGASIRAAMDFVPRMRTALFGDGDPYALDAKAAPDAETVGRLIGEVETLLETTVFGEPLNHWLERRGHAELTAWSAGIDTPAARLIAHLAEKGWTELAAAGSGLAFLDAAMLSGEEGSIPANTMSILPETTLFSRRAQQAPVASLDSAGLEARFAARLTELACLPAEMRLLLDGHGEATTVSRRFGEAGVGIVEAARGLLVHRVRLTGGRVADYRIVSPTDWNFGERGIAARCLTALDGHGDAVDRVTLAHMVVNAIDPCVAYRVRAC